MSVIFNRSSSAYLRLSHSNRYPNGICLEKNHPEITVRYDSTVSTDTNVANRMKINNVCEVKNFLLQFDDDEVAGTGKENSLISLLNAESNLRPLSKNTPSCKSDSNTNQTGIETEDEVTENDSLHDANTCTVSEKSEGKSVKKKKRAKSGRRPKSRHGTTGKGKRATSKSGSTPMTTKVKSESNGMKGKEVMSGVKGLNCLLDSSICKPVVFHKPASHERKSHVMSETMRRRESGQLYRVNSKSAIAKSSSSSFTTKSLTLPQMSSNFMVKSDPVLRLSVGSDSLNSSRSIVQIQKVNDSHSAEITRVTKVFLSDKHSGMVKDCGMEIPMAPPATPTPEQLRRVEYVPSMNDIRSQRAVKVKLQVLEREAQKKSAKRREEVAKIEKQNQKDREKELRIQQRLEIYALNKVMTELENSRFLEFCAKKGISVT